MKETQAQKMAAFAKQCPTAYHTVAEIEERLQKAGFLPLQERDCWKIEKGKDYYVSRNGSSLIAFRVGEQIHDYCFKIAASHSDFPSFKVKEKGELSVQGHYTQLNTEGYGGMLCASWFDRPLSLAGRVVVKEASGFVTKLVKIDRDLLMIPSVAIHMNRAANDGMKYNKQVDMLPLLGDGAGKEGMIRSILAEHLQVEEAQIYGTDLFLYHRMDPVIWGADEEYISCQGFDDLACVYTSLEGFCMEKDRENINVFACFDNEEVGSGTKQGAGSTFLSDVLHRLHLSLGQTEEAFYRAVANSFMVSCDNAHAVHPNHPEYTDKTNQVFLNKGVVIKAHAGQKYTSDGVSMAIWKEICEKAEVPVQYFANRSDMAGGSTLGNIAMTHTSICCVDVGIGQLAMHSAFETGGVKDIEYMVRAMRQLYKGKE